MACDSIFVFLEVAVQYEVAHANFERDAHALLLCSTGLIAGY